MASNQIYALLIEDDPDDVLLLKDALADLGIGKIKLDCVDLLSKGLIQLGAHNYDVILLDLNLPDSRGLETLITTVKRFPKIPVVVLSGLADYAITIEAVRRGAQDYIVKGDINGPLVLRVVQYAIERKQVEAMLRASEARYRTLVETSPNGITLADLEGKLLFCNQQTAHLHGYASPEAMLGMDVFKLFVPGERRQAALSAQRVLNEGRVANAEYTVLRRDGSEFPAEISTALLRNTAGTPVGFISITRDITERKKALETEKQIVMLEREFISSISRDLRTPLLRLIECLDQFQNWKANDNNGNQTLRRASTDANRMLDMVDELLDFSLLESEHLILKYEKVDLGQVISEALQSTREKAMARQISLISAPTDSPLIAEVDTPRMRRALVKLLENAIMFSEKGRTVLVTNKLFNDKITINVIDEGCGIPVEDCERIFEKYYQVSSSSGTNSAGIGLGLYISKQIVDAHRGTLTASSQIGGGSTFTLTIPLEQKDHP